MKLWRVAQWGNVNEGGNGEDTNCIVRANTMDSAIKITEEYFNQWGKNAFKHGITDCVMFLGEDASPLTEEKVVVRKWLEHAINLAEYPAWTREWNTNVWVSNDFYEENCAKLIFKDTLIYFYDGHAYDNVGRYIYDIWNFTAEQLEEEHDYIQWLFPNKEPSFFNPDAPLLTDEVIKEFRNNKKILDNVRKSVDIMRRFYDFNAINPWWCKPNNHNYLRITRILNTLNFLGMIAELDYFWRLLELVYKDNYEAIGAQTFEYWEAAYLGREVRKLE